METRWFCINPLCPCRYRFPSRAFYRNYCACNFLLPNYKLFAFRRDHKMNFERIGAAVSAIWVTIVSVFTRTKSAPWKGRDVFFVVPKRGRIKSVID